MEIFITGIVFFAILSILVFVHELGHFLVAKWAGILVEEFGFGLPPRLFGKKVGETIYSINWLPIGGFVRLYGEDGEDKKSQFKARSFMHKSKKICAAILTAGVTMNFLLAIAITAYLLTSGVMEPSGHVHVERVLKESPAEHAGLLQGDSILSITSASTQKEIHTPRELIEETRTHLGSEITVTILRDGSELSITLIPRKDYPPGEGPMGVAISDLELKTYSWQEAPWIAVKINSLRAKDMLFGIGTLLFRLVTLQPLQPLQADVAGPIGIAQVTGQAVKFGLKAVLEFMSILSLNLAVINILPIPALDGGRLAFVFLEKILGKRFRPAFEQKTHQLGMIILIALILFVSLNDILRLTGRG